MRSSQCNASVRLPMQPHGCFQPIHQSPIRYSRKLLESHARSPTEKNLDLPTKQIVATTISATPTLASRYLNGIPLSGSGVMSAFAVPRALHSFASPVSPSRAPTEIRIRYE